MIFKKLLLLAVFTAALTAWGQKVMTRQKGGTYIINTTTLAEDVKGFKGATPVEIHIKNDVIRLVKPLPNAETPKFFQRVNNGLLPQYEGMAVKEFGTVQVDGVTGATFSSKAVKTNISRGIDYYMKKKQAKR